MSVLDVAHDVGGDAAAASSTLSSRSKILMAYQRCCSSGMVVDGGLLDVGNGMLHGAGEGVHGDGLAALGSLHGGLGGLHDTGTLQGGDLHHLAAQLTGQLRRC